MSTRSATVIASASSHFEEIWKVSEPVEIEAVRIAEQRKRSTPASAEEGVGARPCDRRLQVVPCGLPDGDQSDAAEGAGWSACELWDEKMLARRLGLVSRWL